MTRDIFYIIILKIFSVTTIFGSGIMWFVILRDHYRTNKNLKALAFLCYILAGLASALFFIDGWRA